MTPESQDLIYSLQNYKWETNNTTAKDKPNHDNSHFPDAIRYGAIKLLGSYGIYALNEYEETGTNVRKDSKDVASNYIAREMGASAGDRYAFS